MVENFETVFFRFRFLKAFDRLVLEFDDPAAADADQVIMMLAVLRALV